jgi:hypothetical protein
LVIMVWLWHWWASANNSCLISMSMTKSRVDIIN